jgi:hypothetical protein
MGAKQEPPPTGASERDVYGGAARLSASALVLPFSLAACHLASTKRSLSLRIHSVWSPPGEVRRQC